MREGFCRVSVLLLSFLLSVFATSILPRPSDVIYVLGVALREPAQSVPSVSKSQRFRQTVIGCGVGYSAGWETDDGQRLSEGSQPAKNNKYSTGYRQIL